MARHGGRHDGTRAPDEPAGPGGPAELPDEDGFVLPEAWRPLVAPLRRDGVPVPASVPAADRPVVDPEEAHRREVDAVDERVEWIDRLLADEFSDPGAVAAVCTYLNGEGWDALGAALTARMIRRSDEPDALRGEFEDRVAWAGLSFAVRAVLASFDADLVRVWTGSAARHWVGVLDLEGEQYIDLAAQYGLLALARQALAETPEDEHAAIVEELAQLRTTPLRRAAVARLVPERTEWVEECLAELPRGHSRTATVLRTLLLPALSSVEQVERFAPTGDGVGPDWTPGLVATLADRVGPAVAPLLASALSRYRCDPQERELATMLAEFPTDGAMLALAERLSQPHVRDLLLAAAQRFPVRAVRVLSAAARRGGVNGPVFRELLDRHLALWRPRLPEVLARLDEGTASFVRSLASAREPLPEAPPERVPALLAEPPWAWPRTVRRPEVLTGLTADPEPRLVWRPGEAAAYANGGDPYWRYPADTDWTEVVGELSADAFDWRAARLLAWGPAELVRPYLEDWQPAEYLSQGVHLRQVLGRYGTAALRLLRFAAGHRPEEVAPALGPVLDPTVAGLMADLLVRGGSARSAARSWFARHGVAGALLLVPAAVGPAGAERRAGEHALRRVAAAEGADALLAAVAERYGERARAAVADVLGPGGLARALPGRMPQPPEWLRVEVLPQLLLADGGGALPPPAVRNLLGMLQLGRPREPYPGLAAVLPALRADAAAAFAWALCEEWRHAGTPSKDSWALHALGELGDDDTARRLVPLPPWLSHHRQVDGLDALVSIGSADALAQLHGVARSAKSEVVKERALERISEVAESLGLTAEQLADRLAPDLGLGPDATFAVDYGARTFTVGFDEQLRPYVLDPAGRRRKALPPPAAEDDPGLAAAGRRRFTALKRDVRAFVTERTARLRDAMAAERSWSAAEFRDLLLAHPLLAHLVNRLVWTADGTAFRIAEDRTFADVRDEPFELPADAVLRIAHPLHLGPDLAAWTELFTDYEIVQPFPQLALPIGALTAEEAAGNRLPRFEGRTVPVWRLLALARRDWQQDDPGYGGDGVADRLHKPLPDGRHLLLALDPGIRAHSPAEAVEQRIDAVWFGTSSDYYPPEPPTDGDGGGGGARLGELSPVVASELLADLAELTAD
ncbi:DUF4132 domain-containing protein [Kitasatospora sp. NA04385]|uniref:DUF4132 domain-containing protein n=1 Tax=Kitasatospora sp. NA04385 TaxID=2742135 RepID=UPI001592A0EE|nr:DUF4132 domain-containing protein [Kitasatospora sp. NA04385]QKW18279.1 DUF4132 domain-containing protein [Kitasatospora sp. NA04385]